MGGSLFKLELSGLFNILVKQLALVQQNEPHPPTNIPKMELTDCNI
jgi:hypothetical protein